MKNKNLHAARRAKSNEFYTQMVDIENELQHYTEHFRGKTVFCNCYGPESNFVKYFVDNFDRLGLKKLIAVGFVAEGRGTLITRVGTVLEVGELEGDGDFRSQESIALTEEVAMAMRAGVDLLLLHHPQCAKEVTPGVPGGDNRRITPPGGSSCVRWRGPGPGGCRVPGPRGQRRGSPPVPPNSRPWPGCRRKQLGRSRRSGPAR